MSVCPRQSRNPIHVKVAQGLGHCSELVRAVPAEVGVLGQVKVQAKSALQKLRSCQTAHLCQQRGFRLGKYFIPRCVRRGLDMILRVCPSPPPSSPASGNLAFPSFGIDVEFQKTRFWNGLGHDRSKVSGTWAEIEGVHTNSSRSGFSFMSQIHESLQV